MLELLSLLFFVGWIIATIFMPNLLYGYSWADIVKIMSNDDLATLTELIKQIGFTDENSNETATRYFITCIAASIILLIIIIIIKSILNNIVNPKPVNTINSDTPVKTKYSYSVTYISNNFYSDYTTINIEFVNKILIKRSLNIEKFSAKINNQIYSFDGFIKKNKLVEIIKIPNSNQILTLRINQNLENTNFEILFKGKQLKIGEPIKVYNNEIVE